MQCARYAMTLTLATLVASGCGSSRSKSNDAPTPAGAPAVAPPADQHPGAPPVPKTPEKGPAAPMPPVSQPPAPTPPVPPPAGHPGEPPPAPPPPAAVSDLQTACTAAWPKQAATYKVGLVKVYEVSTKTSKRGGTATETRQQRRDTVTDGSGDTFKIEHRVSGIAPTVSAETKATFEISKDKFIANCVAGLVPELDSKTQITQITSHPETLAVKAGSFDTVYVQSKETTDEDDGAKTTCDRETWGIGGASAALQIFAKTVDRCQFVLNGAPVVQEQTAELVELKLP